MKKGHRQFPKGWSFAQACWALPGAGGEGFWRPVLAAPVQRNVQPRHFSKPNPATLSVMPAGCPRGERGGGRGALWGHHPGFWTLIDREMNSHCPLLCCGVRVCHFTFISLSFPICKLGMIITLRHKVDARVRR